jgi:hypothetical protein
MAAKNLVEALFQSLGIQEPGIMNRDRLVVERKVWR